MNILNAQELSCRNHKIYSWFESDLMRRSPIHQYFHSIHFLCSARLVYTRFDIKAPKCKIIFFQLEKFDAQKTKRYFGNGYRERCVVLMTKSLLCEHERDEYVEINNSITYSHFYRETLDIFNYSFFNGVVVLLVLLSVFVSEFMIILLFINKLIIT